MRWDYFYDEIGRRLVTLVRRMHPHLQSGEHYFYNDAARYQARDVLLFSRQENGAFTLVALNVGDAEQVVSFRFPIARDYQEELHGEDALQGVRADADQMPGEPEDGKC